MPETVERFENAIKAKRFMIFAELDHAAAATKYGLELRPRTVIVQVRYGPDAEVPDVGDRYATEGAGVAGCSRERLDYNSAEYLGATIYPRHGLQSPPEARQALEQLLTEVSDQSTK